LQGLKARDEIQVQWFDSRKHEFRERIYTVDDILIVTPEEVSALTPPSGDSLTLITCYPFGRSPRSPQRFVVLASPAGPSRLPKTSYLANRSQL
jgi:LPXTG-site transpeptidase (sortase) family protein